MPFFFNLAGFLIFFGIPLSILAHKNLPPFPRTFFGIIGTLPALIIRPLVSKIGVGKTKVVDPGSTIVQDPSNPYSPPASPPKNLLDN